MFNRIIEFYKKQDWAYTIVKDKQVVLLGISGKNGKFQFVVDVNEDKKRIVALSICNSNVPEAKMSYMSELLTQINYGKFLGNFELNFDDGEIRYKTSMYYSGTELSDDVIKNLLMVNIASMDTGLPAIMKLLYNEISPKDAIRCIETVEEE